MEVGLTDTLHDMEKIGVRRLERAALLDGMPARMAAGWEALRDRVRETGQAGTASSFPSTNGSASRCPRNPGP